MRIGLLGASRIAPAAIIKPASRRRDVSVTAVAARDPERAKTFAAEHGIAATASCYADLVTRDDVDVVYCALPALAHADICEKALAAGKMLLVEKPFAADGQAAKRIAAAADAAGRPALEAFHYRFHVQFGRALELVRSGALGQIRRAEGVFDVPIPKTPEELRWRADLGGGAIMDLGCYVIHALRTLLGGEPTIGCVDAETDSGVDAEMRVELGFGGVVAVAGCSMARPIRAKIFLEGDEGDLTLHNFVAPQHGGRLVLRTKRGDTAEEAVVAATTYDAQMEHLVQVWRGEAAPLTGGSDAVANMTVIDACRAAMRRGTEH